MSVNVARLGMIAVAGSAAMLMVISRFAAGAVIVVFGVLAAFGVHGEGAFLWSGVLAGRRPIRPRPERRLVTTVSARRAP